MTVPVSTKKPEVKKKAAPRKVIPRAVMEKQEEPTTRKEQWAKARFSYIDMKDYPGAVWKCSPQGMREEFKDGEEYERPLSLFKMLNEGCREVKRRLVKPPSGDVGHYVKTNQFNRRIWFEILKTWEKEVPIKRSRSK